MPRKRPTKQNASKQQPTPEEIAEERIKLWKQKKDRFPSEFLELSNLGLTTFPEGLRDARGLEYINLGQNRISTIPDWIGELSSLRLLGLDNNRLKKLPESIGNLPKLTTLWLNRNLLEELPISLRRTQLTILDLWGNRKLRLPASILDRAPEEILRYYFESRLGKGTELLELKLLLVGRGGAGKTTLVKQLAGEKPDEREPETHSISIRDLTLDCKRGKVKKKDRARG